MHKIRRFKSREIVKGGVTILNNEFNHIFFITKLTSKFPQDKLRTKK